MKKLLITACAILVVTSPCSLAATRWMIDIMPAAITASFASDTFKLSGNGQEEEISMVSSMPGIGAGLYFDTPNGYFDVKCGGGFLLNSRVRSYMIYASTGLSFEVERSAMIGPHIGVIHFSGVEWWGDGETELSDSTGLMTGIHVTMGDKISYILSLDYIRSVFDVTPVEGWTPSDDELDLSGFAVQFGFRAHF